MKKGKEISGRAANVFLQKIVERAQSIRLFARSTSNPSQTSEKNRFHLNKKLKIIISLSIIAIILISVFAFIPKSSPVVEPPIVDPTASPSPNATATATAKATQAPTPRVAEIKPKPFPFIPSIVIPPIFKAPGVLETAPVLNSSVWKEVAANAWAAFQPDIGVDMKTGLPFAGGRDFRAFTDWDLGSYIQAVINAEKIGLINKTATSSDWGANDRLEKVLTFLENRPLNTSTSNRYAYWFYDATTVSDYYHPISDTAATPYDGADSGRLLVALYNLKVYNPAWAQRIDDIVYNKNGTGNRTNYASMVPGFLDHAYSNSIYAYYIVSGFASFFPNQTGTIPTSILNNIDKTPTITSNGVVLPNASVCNEPLIAAYFEINNADSARLKSFVHQVYLAHEAYYNANDRRFVAPSEGMTPGFGWLYEWVVAPNGQTWVATNSDQTQYYSLIENSVIYTKVAFSFLALENSTYSKDLAIWTEKVIPTPTHGYADGADTGGNIVNQVSINTNSLILDAALYALKK